MPNDPDSPYHPAGERVRERTVLETDESIRQALQAGLKPRHEIPEAHLTPSPAPAPEGRPAVPYRPTARPPVALLTVCDDGTMEGEVIRIREPHFVIGRTEGNLQIPVDGRMSARHVEITLQTVGGLHRWVVTDLQSTHGMFVRVSRTALADKAEFLVGGGRYRLDLPTHESAETAAYNGPEAFSGETQAWTDGPGPFRPPALTELIGREIGNRILLVKPEYWIGSDPSCPIPRPDDAFCEFRHVRLFRAANGVWHAEHNKTKNGLWLRVSQITLESMIHFQIGEQRFRLNLR